MMTWEEIHALLNGTECKVSTVVWVSLHIFSQSFYTFITKLALVKALSVLS